MIDQAIAAYAHYLGIFTALGLLVAELALFRPRMDAATVRLLPRLDLSYLVAVIAIIVTGLLRVFFFAKGPDYYAGNGIFWIKMALFLLVGLLSRPPTLLFLRLRKETAGLDATLAAGRFRRARWFIVAELAVFALIPLAAALMARGVDI
jgi:putative membrane protein